MYNLQKIKTKCTIKTFVNRYRKIKHHNLLFIKKYIKRFGINVKKKKINFQDIFPICNNNDIIIEIGFGTGNSIIHLAKQYSTKFFIGIEVYLPGVFYCLKKIKQYKIKNLKIIYFDALSCIHNKIPNSTVSVIQLFFPDPWKKKKHYKRRIIQKQFIHILWKKLVYGGLIHIITDCQNYIMHILKVFKSFDFINISYNLKKIFYFRNRVFTKFEQKSIRKKIQVKHILFKKINRKQLLN